MFAGAWLLSHLLYIHIYILLAYGLRAYMGNIIAEKTYVYIKMHVDTRECDLID